MISLKSLKFCGLILLLISSEGLALSLPVPDLLKKAFANLFYSSKPKPQSPQITEALELEPWDRPLYHGINQSYIPKEFHLVEIKKENPSIIIDMKYTTRNNCAGEPTSVEKKCLVSRKVMDKLNNVQAELEQQGLGLKVFDAFRPLHRELSVYASRDAYRNTSIPQEFDIYRPGEKYIIKFDKNFVYRNMFAYYKNKWQDILNIPFSNRGAMVAVTLVTQNSKELVMPTKFDDHSEKARPEYQDLPEEVIKNKELLTRVMLKHGFKQGLLWYDFYDVDAENFPRLLYTNYTTARNFINNEECSGAQASFSALSRMINQILFTHEHRDALTTDYSWDVPQREIGLIDKLFSIPWKFHLVEVAQKNSTIIVDMKYVTKDNCAHKPVSAETKCLVSRNVMNKLNRVQAELKKQGLGLKVFDGFRPLYVEAALVKYGNNFISYPYNDFCFLYNQECLRELEPRFASYDPMKSIQQCFFHTPPLIPFSNKGALVAVTLVDACGKELAMPTKFDERGEQSSSYYQQLPEDILTNRELLKEVMLKHGFKQADTWYEFYDDEIDQYPHWLYASYITALQLDEEQENDRTSMAALVNALIYTSPFKLVFSDVYYRC